METRTGKERMLASLQGDTTSGPIGFAPITMMYAADLVGESYKRYETTASVQAAGQIAIAERFGASVVSVISDPAVEAHDLGAHVEFPDDSPAHLVEEKSLLAETGDLASLVSRGVVAPENGARMANRLAAVQQLHEKTQGDLLVEGWVEGPCAEAADLRGINRLMMDFFGDTEFLAELLDFIAEQEIAFAQAQINAGADIIGIGDAASSLVGPDLYAEWIVPRTRRYVEAIHEAGALVRLHICGRTEQLAPSIARLGVDMIDVDFGNDIEAMRSEFEAVEGPGGGPAVAGNIDPVTELKDGTPDHIAGRLAGCRRAAGTRFIVGAGCEVPRGTPPENLEAMRRFAEEPA